MVALNIIITFAEQLMDFISDVSNFFTKIIANIHNFLNRFMSDEIILVFGIAIGAFLAILLFRAVINKR